MATQPRPVRREPTLAPSRWAALPRRGTVLRLALATMLLALAAGVLYAREPQQSCLTGPATTPHPGGDPQVTNPAAAAAADPSAGSAAGPTAADTPHSNTPDSGGPPTSTGHRLPLPTGMVGVPIRLAEPAALAVVRPGTRVDLLAVSTAGTGAASPSTGPTLIAARALVLDVLGTDPAVDPSTALYLALPPDQAHRVIAVPDNTRFVITIRA